MHAVSGVALNAQATGRSLRSYRKPLMTSLEADPCLGDDADMLQDLGIGFVPGGQPAHARAGSPRRSAAVTSPAPSVVDLLSDSDTAPSPTARDASAGRLTGADPSALVLPAPEQPHSPAAAAAIRSPSVNRLLADMVDLLSGSDDEPDAAMAAALAEEEDCKAATAAGSPAASPPRRKSSSRRVRKPARFKDAGAGLVTSPTRESSQRSGGAADAGPTVWPSPPEDSFINDHPADSVPVSPEDAPIPSPRAKRCGP